MRKRWNLKEKHWWAQKGGIETSRYNYSILSTCFLTFFLQVSGQQSPDSFLHIKELLLIIQQAGRG